MNYLKFESIEINVGNFRQQENMLINLSLSPMEIEGFYQRDPDRSRVMLRISK